MSYLDDRMDLVITELVDTICLYQFQDEETIYLHFSAKTLEIMLELSDSYSKQELDLIQARIEQYPFQELIHSLSKK